MSHISDVTNDDRPVLASLCRALIAAVEGRKDDAQREIDAARAMLTPQGAAEGPTSPEERAAGLKWLESLP